MLMMSGMSDLGANSSTLDVKTDLHRHAAQNDVEAIRRYLNTNPVAVVDSRSSSKLWTPLHEAALRGCLDAIRVLVLEHNADVNAETKSGSTALHLAARKGHVAAVRLLVSLGANVRSRDANGETAVHWACALGLPKVLVSFAEKDISLPSLLWESGCPVDNSGKSALHRATTEIWDSIISHPKARMEVDLTSVRDTSGWTPFHDAAAAGDHQLVARMLHHARLSTHSMPAAGLKHLVLHQTSTSKGNAMHLACRGGHIAVIKLLLDASQMADPHRLSCLEEIVFARDSSLETPLHWAVVSKNRDVVSVILSVVRKLSDAPGKMSLQSLVNQRNEAGLSAVHLAARYGFADVLTMLISHDKSKETLDAKESHSLWTALHDAAAHGHDACIQVLINAGSMVQARDILGKTPLHYASSSGVESVRSILETKSGLECLWHPSSDTGWLPLHEACAKGKSEVCQLLCRKMYDSLSKKASSPKEILFSILLATTKRKSTPLHLASRCSDSENGSGQKTVQALLYFARSASADLDCKKFADAKDEWLETPLHWAAYAGQEECCTLLLEYGASVHATSKTEATPIHLAARYGHLQCLRALVDEGKHEVLWTLLGEENKTPLDEAAASGSTIIIDWFLSAEGTVRLPRTARKLPGHWAAMNDQQDIIHLVLQMFPRPSSRRRVSFFEIQEDDKVESPPDNLSLWDLDHPDEDGWTPLHHAAARGHFRSCAMLLFRKDLGNAVDVQEAAALFPSAAVRQAVLSSLSEADLHDRYTMHASTASRSPLHLAMRSGSSKVMDILLLYGCVKGTMNDLLLLPDEDGWTPIHWMFFEGNFELLSHLHAVWKAFDSPELLLTRDLEGFTPYLRSVSAGKGAFLESLRSLKIAEIPEAELIQESADLEGWTVAHVAAFFGHHSLFQLWKTRVIADRTAKGSSCLHISCRKSYPQCVSEICNLCSTADTFEDVLCSSDEWGMTPLHWCALQTSKDGLACLATVMKNILHYETFRALNCEDASASTALHLAAFAGNAFFIGAFLLLAVSVRKTSMTPKVRAKIVESMIAQTTRRMQNTVHLACGSGHVDSVALLLGFSRIVEHLDSAALVASLLDDACVGPTMQGLLKEVENHITSLSPIGDVSDQDGQHPAHYACKEGSDGCLQILLSCGYNALQADKSGSLPVSYAARKGSVRCMALIFNLEPKCASFVSHSGTSVLDDAVASGSFLAVQMVLQHLDKNSLHHRSIVIAALANMSRTSDHANLIQTVDTGLRFLGEVSEAERCALARSLIPHVWKASVCAEPYQDAALLSEIVHLAADHEELWMYLQALLQKQSKTQLSQIDFVPVLMEYMERGLVDLVSLLMSLLTEKHCFSTLQIENLLVSAVTADQAIIADSLLKAKWELCDRDQNCLANTACALHFVRSLSCCKLLVEKYGFDADHQDGKGNCPFHTVCSVECLEFLSWHSETPNWVTVRNTDTNTPLMMHLQHLMSKNASAHECEVCAFIVTKTPENAIAALWSDMIRMHDRSAIVTRIPHSLVLEIIQRNPKATVESFLLASLDYNTRLAGEIMENFLEFCGQPLEANTDSVHKLSSPTLIEHSIAALKLQNVQWMSLFRSKHSGSGLSPVQSYSKNNWKESAVYLLKILLENANRLEEKEKEKEKEEEKDEDKDAEETEEILDCAFFLCRHSFSEWLLSILKNAPLLSDPTRQAQILLNCAFSGEEPLRLASRSFPLLIQDVDYSLLCPDATFNVALLFHRLFCQTLPKSELLAKEVCALINHSCRTNCVDFSCSEIGVVVESDLIPALRQTDSSPQLDSMIAQACCSLLERNLPELVGKLITSYPSLLACKSPSVVQKALLSPNCEELIAQIERFRSDLGQLLQQQNDTEEGASSSHANQTIDSTTESLASPLHLAVCKNDADSLVLLLRQYPTTTGKALALNATFSPNGNNPLHAAVTFGSAEIVSILLQHGADLLVRSSTPFKETAVHLASRLNRVSILKVLLEEAKSKNLSVLEIRDGSDRGCTPLLSSALGVAPASAALLLNSGALCAVQTIDTDAFFPTHLATVSVSLNLSETKAMSLLPFIKTMFDLGRFPHGARDQGGRTTLMTVWQSYRDPVFEQTWKSVSDYLVSVGSLLTSVRDSSGRSVIFSMLEAAVREEVICDIYRTNVIQQHVEISNLFEDIQERVLPRNDTALHLCALLGYDALLETLLTTMSHHFLEKDQRFDETENVPDLQNSLGETPLHSAVVPRGSPGHSRAIGVLLRFGASPRSKTKGESKTPLHLAVALGANDAALILLSFPCPDSIQQTLPIIRDYRGWTPIHEAAFHNNPICLRALIDALPGTLKDKKICLDLETSAGSTALHLACRSGSSECVRYLLSLFEPPADAAALYQKSATSKRSSLSCALHSEDEKTIDFVLNCCRNSSEPLLQANLLECGNAQNGYSLLHTVFSLSKASTMQKILGSLPTDVIPKLCRPSQLDGKNPFHIAAANSASNTTTLETVLACCNNRRIPLLERDADGWMPVHYAAACNNFEILATVLPTDSPLTQLTTADDNSNPVLICSRFGTVDCLKSLCEMKGAESFLLACWATNDEGCNAYFETLKEGHEECFQFLVSVLHTNGKEAELIRKKDTKDRNILHYAALSGRPRMVETVLKFGVDVNAQDGDGATPLHYACRSGAVIASLMSFEDITLEEGGGMQATRDRLSKAEADAEQPASAPTGNTSVERSCPRQYDQVLGILLRKGADPFAVTHREKITPLFELAFKNNAELGNCMLSILLQEGLAIPSKKANSSRYSTVRDLLAVSSAQDGTAFHCCATRRFKEFLLCLFSVAERIREEGGLSVTPLLTSANQEGQALVHYLASWGNVEMFSKLRSLDSAAMDVLNGTNCHAIHIAALHDHNDLIAFILDVEHTDSLGNPREKATMTESSAVQNGCAAKPRGKTPLVQITDHAKATPLHMAARAGCPHAIQQLLSDKRTETSTEDEEGECPLLELLHHQGHHATPLATRESLVAFLQCSRVDRTARNSRTGQNGIHYLISSQADTSLAEMLLYGDGPSVPSEQSRRLLLEGTDNEGQTPLHCAASVEPAPVQWIKFLVSKNVGKNGRDKYGVTPFLRYVAEGTFGTFLSEVQLEILNALCTRECVVSADEDGTTPLHEAVRKNSLGVTEWLLNRVDDYNTTVDSSKQQFIEANIPNRNKVTPLDICKNGKISPAIEKSLKMHVEALKDKRKAFEKQRKSASKNQ
eukprot:ANDGO_04753.mRNA.1 Putative ankyrin repeat protein RF_0381